jgi:hypothetical protein
MAAFSDHERASVLLSRIDDSNAYRLDSLHARDIAFGIHGPAVLEFLFQRIIATKSTQALRRDWVLQVARLLDLIETETAESRGIRVAVAS